MNDFAGEQAIFMMEQNRVDSRIAFVETNAIVPPDYTPARRRKKSGRSGSQRPTSLS